EKTELDIQQRHEKLTFNMSPVDLGKVDVLVEHGHYTNRTDFIRTAIRSQLEKHHLELQQAIAAQSFVIGIVTYSRKHLESLQASHKKLRLTVVGALHLAEDIPAELAAEVIESVRLRGIFSASSTVKAALADRMQ